MVFAVLLFSGCEFFQEDKGTTTQSKEVVGTWESSYGEVYTLEFRSGSNDYYFSSSYDGAVSYGGTVANSPDLTATEGYLVFPYEETTSYNADYAGEYYGVRWSQFSGDTVNWSGAYKADGVSSTQTAAEALEEFTYENGYFASGSDCARVE